MITLITPTSVLLSVVIKHRVPSLGEATVGLMKVQNYLVHISHGLPTYPKAPRALLPTPWGLCKSWVCFLPHVSTGVRPLPTPPGLTSFSPLLSHHTLAFQKMYVVLSSH